MTALNNVGAILRKEWRHYFGSPIAWVALVIWAFVYGFFHFALVMSLTDPAMGRGMGRQAVNDAIGWQLESMAVVALFALPLLTMRLFAEEKRQGTMELLSTAPISDLQIVLGKFTGAVGLYALMLLSGLLNVVPLFLRTEAPPEWRILASAVLGMLLLGAAMIAFGMFVSSLTRNQIVAGVVTIGVLLTLWLVGWLFSNPTAGPVSKVIAYLSLRNHVDDMMKGVIDLKDVVFYLSFVAAGIFLTHRSLESQRWRA